jgi:hypothetical protein
MVHGYVNNMNLPIMPETGQTKYDQNMEVLQSEHHFDLFELCAI